MNGERICQIGDEGDSRLLNREKRDHERAAQKAEEILKAHEPKPLTLQSCGEKEAQANGAEIRAVEH